MAGLRELGRSDANAAGLRARRWDVIVLGSGITGVVAAARLGMAGHRVLVVEEEATRALPAAVREPFFLAGANDGGVLDQCLRELSVPLIERRRLEASPLAFQLIGEDLRMDLGEAGWTAEELVAWGLAKPEAARTLVRALAEAGDAERQALLEGPIVRVGRRLNLGRTGGGHARGLPVDASLDASLEAVLDGELRALHHLASAEPSPEARARLLSVPLAGGAAFAGPPPWLHGVLRRRAESVYAEFRALSAGFELISMQGEPGIAIPGQKDLWIGRSLVIAAPTSGLAAALEGELPSFLPGKRQAARRAVVSFRVAKSALPEGMSERVVLLPERDGEPVATVAAFAVEDDRRQIDWVVRTRTAPGESEAAVVDRLERRLRDLAPLAGEALVRRPVRVPVWDDEDLLEDPEPGHGWPAEVELRLSSRPPVYLLDRAALGGLGLEGDLLLGWRGGDAIAAELA